MDIVLLLNGNGKFYYSSRAHKKFLLNWSTFKNSNLLYTVHCVGIANIFAILHFCELSFGFSGVLHLKPSI